MIGNVDAVFSDGQGRYCVVEAKYLDLHATGRTACTGRTHKRGPPRMLRTMAYKWKLRMGHDTPERKGRLRA